MLWPKNYYLEHSSVVKFWPNEPMYQARQHLYEFIFIDPTPFDFVPEEEILSDVVTLYDLSYFYSSEHKVKFKFVEWNYNGFKFEIESPQDGHLLIRQIYDPLWKITLDGNEIEPQSALHGAMIMIPISSGVHEITMEYWPLARYLYWPAAILLEISLIILVLGIVFQGKKEK